MKHQKGAVLIVVLSLLTVSLMVGLSSMQSSQIDERLAGNYRAQAEALMNAETGLSDFFSINKQCGDMRSAVEDGFLAGGSYELDARSNVSNMGFFNIYMRGFAEQARVVVRASGSCEEPLSMLASRGAYSCVEGDCGFQQGASQNGGIDGHDHTMDGADGCKVSKSGGDDRAGAIFSDANFSSQGYSEEDINELNVDGKPSYLANLDTNGDGFVDDGEVDKFLNADYLSDLFVNYDCEEVKSECLSSSAEASVCDNQYKSCRSDAVNAAVESIRLENELILDYFLEPDVQSLPMVHVVNEDDVLEVKGRLDGVVVLNGGTLVIGGGSCIVGAVVGYGNADVAATGNPEIVGSVIAKDLDFTGRGRPGIKFSSDALRVLDELFNIAKKEFGFDSWEDESGEFPSS